MQRRNAFVHNYESTYTNSDEMQKMVSEEHVC